MTAIIPTTKSSSNEPETVRLLQRGKRITQGLNQKDKTGWSQRQTCKACSSNTKSQDLSTSCQESSSHEKFSNILHKKHLWSFLRSGSYDQLSNPLKVPGYECKSELIKKAETNLSPSTRHGPLTHTAPQSGTKPTQTSSFHPGAPTPRRARVDEHRECVQLTPTRWYQQSAQPQAAQASRNRAAEGTDALGSWHPHHPRLWARLPPQGLVGSLWGFVCGFVFLFWYFLW